MFEYLKRRSAAARLFEERLYEQVVLELRNRQRREGLWAKAVANSQGSDDLAKSLYIQYRIQSMKDELEISAAFSGDEKRSEYAELLVNAAGMTKDEKIWKSYEVKKIFEHDGKYIVYGKVFASLEEAAAFIEDCNKYG